MTGNESDSDSLWLFDYLNAMNGSHRVSCQQVSVQKNKKAIKTVTDISGHFREAQGFMLSKTICLIFLIGTTTHPERNQDKAEMGGCDASSGF